MKKNFLLLLISVSLAGGLHAQTFDEWFRQKKTQKEYLLQQIGALQVYIGYARKGYNIAEEGLATIGGFTRGELTQHRDYFSTLKTVNPEIRKYAKVADIMACQVKIIQHYHSRYRWLSSAHVFSKDELAYIRRVFANLLDDCEKTLDELIAITTDGRLEMKDDERLARIDKLYLDMQDKLIFCHAFGSDATMLAASRLNEQTDIQTGRALHGIKNK